MKVAWRAVTGSLILLAGFALAQVVWATSAEFDITLTVEGCNSNLVCEPAFGENPSSCSSDCTNFQCSDGVDNDGDTYVDYPDDPQCESLLDNKEADDGGGSGGGGGGAQALCTISAIPSTITAGETSTLVWTSTYSELSRTILPDVGAVAETGSVVVAPTTDTTYAGIFTGLRTTTFCSATITVIPLEEATGVIRLSADSYAVEERDGEVVISLERMAGASGAISVRISTTPGSASEADFTPIDQTVSWADGDTGTKTVTIPILTDVFEETTETFTVALSSELPGVLGDPNFATISILDNNVKEEREVGYVTLLKQVINNDTGTKGANDFVLLLGGEQVSSGQTVTVHAGEVYVLDELASNDYVLSSVGGSSACPSQLPGNLTLAKDQVVTCIITNNDRPFTPKPGVAQFSGGTFRVSEGDTTRITLRRIDGSDGPLQVRVISIPGTAQPSEDYVALSTVIGWADGSSGERSFVLATTEDNLIEGDETLTLVLEVITGSLGSPSSALIIIEDDDIPEPDCIGAECFVEEIRVGIPPDSPLLRVVVPVVGKVEELATWYDNPRTQQVTRLASGIGALGGAIGLLSVGFGLQNLWWSLIRLISLLLSAIGLRRSARPWGVVYDSITKQPLDPAYVSLHDVTGKELEGAITDLDGRYGFLVEPGTYWMRAKKTNYSFPSARLEGQDRDELYDNLYFGDPIEITEEGQVITKNIPLDPDKFDWNEFAKRDMRVMKYYRRRDKLIARVVDALFVVGFAVTFGIFLLVPNAYNYLVLLVYVGMITMRLLGLKRRKSGVVIDEKTGNPLSFAAIKIISVKSGQEVGHSVTDQAGRYYKLIADGIYIVRILQKVTEEHFEPVFESEPIEVKRGILNQNFSVKNLAKPL